MILAGGRVDDLGVLTLARPKSAMPFGGLYRIIDFSLSNLMHSDIERVGILSQYKPHSLLEHVGNGESWDMLGRNRFAAFLPPFKGINQSDWYQGTADAVFQNLDFLRTHRPEHVLILSGDHVYQMDYREVIRFHNDNKADLTIVFAKVPREGAHRFGLAEIECERKEGGRVIQYLEKPETPAFDWASLTIYVFTPYVLLEALEANATKDSHEFGRDIIPWLLEHNYNVYGYKHDGYWGYTRTPREYWQTSMDFLGSTPRVDFNDWQICTNLSHGNIRDRRPALVGHSALIEDSLLYSGCRIAGTVKNSILFPGVRVDEGAHVEDSILFFNAVIKRNSRIIRTITDENVTVGVNTQVGEQDSEDLSIIGMNTRIPRDTTIAAGANVHPDLGPAQFSKHSYGQGETVQ